MVTDHVVQRRRQLPTVTTCNTVMTLRNSLILYEHNMIRADQLSCWLSRASTLRTELTVLPQHGYLWNRLYSFAHCCCRLCEFVVVARLEVLGRVRPRSQAPQERLC